MQINPSNFELNDTISSYTSDIRKEMDLILSSASYKSKFFGKVPSKLKSFNIPIVLDDETEVVATETDLMDIDDSSNLNNNDMTSHNVSNTQDGSLMESSQYQSQFNYVSQPDEEEDNEFEVKTGKLELNNELVEWKRRAVGLKEELASVKNSLPDGVSLIGEVEQVRLIILIN